MSKILRRRAEDCEGVARIVDLNASDPAIISPTIAHTPAPPTLIIIDQNKKYRAFAMMYYGLETSFLFELFNIKKKLGPVVQNVDNVIFLMEMSKL